jgi:hypothetical protein
MPQRLLNLIGQAHALHAASTGQDWLVQPSVPILFFGNLDRYRRSGCRIITVAKNPSSQEFPSGNPFLRFPNANQSNNAYLAALSNYFDATPYDLWFSAYAKVLAGANAR